MAVVMMVVMMTMMMHPTAATSFADLLIVLLIFAATLFAILLPQGSRGDVAHSLNHATQRPTFSAFSTVACSMYLCH